METYTTRQTRAANAMRSRHLIAGWEDAQKPGLDRVIDAALALSRALDGTRYDLMRAKDIEALDAYACDTTGQAIDLLNSLLGTQRAELVDCDGDTDRMRLDISSIEEEHRIWEARWAARKDGVRRFPDVACSSCGKHFGPGDHGFSHCRNHAHLAPKL